MSPGRSLVPVGSASGARAVAAAIAAGFVVVLAELARYHPGEVRTVLQHPDGRRLEVSTTRAAQYLVRAQALDRHLWPRGVVGVVDSVPKVVKLVGATKPA